MTGHKSFVSVESERNVTIILKDKYIDAFLKLLEYWMVTCDEERTNITGIYEDDICDMVATLKAKLNNENIKIY